MHNERYNRKRFIIGSTATAGYLLLSSCKARGVPVITRKDIDKPQVPNLLSEGVYEAGINRTVHTKHYSLTHKLTNGWKLSASDNALKIVSEEFGLPIPEAENTHVFVTDRRVNGSPSFLDSYQISKDGDMNNISISVTEILEDLIKKSQRVPSNKNDFRVLSHFLSTTAIGSFAEIAVTQGKLSPQNAVESWDEYNKVFAFSQFHPLSIWHINPEELLNKRVV